MTMATWCVPIEGVCFRNASMSFMRIGRIAYPDVSTVTGTCSDGAATFAEFAAVLPLVLPDLGRAACIHELLQRRCGSGVVAQAARRACCSPQCQQISQPVLIKCAA
jgi:hypothetical protein